MSYLFICINGSPRSRRESVLKVIGESESFILPDHTECSEHGTVTVRQLKKQIDYSKNMPHGHFAIHKHSVMASELMEMERS